MGSCLIPKTTINYYKVKFALNFAQEELITHMDGGAHTN